MEEIVHTAQLVRYIQEHYSNPKALNFERDGNWTYMSTGRFVSRVRELALGLFKLGLKRGEKVAILADSSPEWTIADLAIGIAGGVSVPLFATISDKNFAFEVEESESRLLFVSGQREWELYLRHKKLFKQAIYFNGKPPADSVLTLDELCKKGAQCDVEEPSRYQELEEAIRPDDLLTIIYTSGSTGVPKGAMLSHRNLMWLIQFPDFGWDRAQDLYLSILPLAHIFARQLNYIILGWGVPIYYLNNLQLILKMSQKLRPTLMIVVPRLLEKMYAGMVADLEKGQAVRRLVGRWAFGLAMQEEGGLCKYLFSPLADKIVYSELREALGGRFRVVMCGGAVLSPHLQQFFLEIGIPIYEGWGLTEASTVAVNLIGKRKVGTVGPLLPGTEAKITEEGEILIRGPTVMKGYFKNPEETMRVLNREGWLHTGDRGALDEEGFLRLTGRIKELYKMSTGKYVSPLPIESALSESPLVDMAFVVAEKRPFVTCLLFPDRAILNQLKKTQERELFSDEDFLESEAVQQEIRVLIEEVNRELNSWEQIQAWRFVPESLTIEAGDLSPTLKIKRDVVEEKYRDLIEPMYARAKR